MNQQNMFGSTPDQQSSAQLEKEKIMELQFMRELVKLLGVGKDKVPQRRQVGSNEPTLKGAQTHQVNINNPQQISKLIDYIEKHFELYGALVESKSFINADDTRNRIIAEMVANNAVFMVGNPEGEVFFYVENAQQSNEVLRSPDLSRAA